MTSLIYKDNFSVTPDRRTFTAPGTNVRVLSLSNQGEFWYSFDPDRGGSTNFEILTAWTGQLFDLEDKGGWEFVGTAMLLPANLVLHVYWRRIR